MIIKENLYQLKGCLSMRNFFFTANSDEEAISFIYKDHRDTGLVLNRLELSGAKPKVPLYTSETWKKLSKEKHSKKI